MLEIILGHGLSLRFKSLSPLLIGSFVLFGSLVLSGCIQAEMGDDPGRVDSIQYERSLLLEETSETSANVSIGDVTGNGHLDIILVKGRHWPLANLVLEGDGEGTFVPARPLGGPADRSYSGVLVDMTGNGALDVVVSNDSPDGKVVYFNDGEGNFSVGSSFGRPEWPTRHVHVADLNGNGHPDIVVANRYGAREGFNYVCVNEGGGHFDGDCRAFSGESATSIAVADFQGNGSLDLLVPHRDGGQSYIYLNDGAAHFPERIPFGPADASIRSAIAVDLDGDGILDVVAIDQERGPLIFMGQPELTFAPGVPPGSGLATPYADATPYALGVHDLNQNGRPDVIVGFVSAPSVAYLNAGDGRTFTEVPFGDGEGTVYGFSFGDVDADGFVDIAVARSGAPNVLFFGGPTTAGTPINPQEGLSTP